MEIHVVIIQNRAHRITPWKHIIVKKKTGYDHKISPCVGYIYDIIHHSERKYRKDHNLLDVFKLKE